MKQISLSVILVVGTVLSQCAFAETANKWSGNVELGIISTNGNTKTQNVAAKGQVIIERSRWRHNINVEVLNSSEQSTTTAERYFVSGKSEFRIDEKSYVFGLLSYENDRFSGFDYRWMETLGYGRRIVDRSNLILHLEGGVGARQSRVSDTGAKQNEGIIHLGGNLRWTISGTSNLTEDLYSDIGADSTITKSVTALNSRIAGNLASKIAFTARHTSHVPLGIKKLDTELTVTLVYNF